MKGKELKIEVDCASLQWKVDIILDLLTSAEEMLSELGYELKVTITEASSDAR